MSTAIYLLSHNLALSMNFAGLKILPLWGAWRGKLFDFRFVCNKWISLFWSHFTGDTHKVPIELRVSPACLSLSPPVRLWFLVNYKSLSHKNQYWRYCKGYYAKACKVTGYTKKKNLILDGAIWHSRYLLKHFWMNQQVLEFLQNHLVLIYTHIWI